MCLVSSFYERPGLTCTWPFEICYIHKHHCTRKQHVISYLFASAFRVNSRANCIDEMKIIYRKTWNFVCSRPSPTIRRDHTVGLYCTQIRLALSPVGAIGDRSISRSSISLSPRWSRGPGMYSATWGPLAGQYHPRLKPLTHAIPCIQLVIQ